MNGLTYALLAYSLTAVISLGVVGLIVLINRVMHDRSSTGEQ